VKTRELGGLSPLEAVATKVEEKKRRYGIMEFSVRQQQITSNLTCTTLFIKKTTAKFDLKY